MEKRITVETSELEDVYSILQNKGYTLDKINKEIDGEFRNHLYKGVSFPPCRFDRLKKLLDRDIEHQEIFFVNGKGITEQIKLGKNRDLAELFGILLGDGHLDKHSRDRGDRYISSYYVCVTLSTEEDKLISRTKELFRECLGEDPRVQDLNHASALNIKIYGKEVVQALEELGLKSGNKTENQVGVPSWIKDNKDFWKPCLRGLIDTDGSIYERQSGNRVVYFKNKSRPLLDDFEYLCERIGINVSRAGEDARQIAAQKQVEKFVTDIDPIKANN